MRYLYIFLITLCLIYPQVSFAQKKEEPIYYDWGVQIVILSIGFKVILYDPKHSNAIMVLSVNKRGPLWWVRKGTIIRSILVDGKEILLGGSINTILMSLNSIYKEQILLIRYFYQDNNLVQTGEMIVRFKVYDK